MSAQAEPFRDYDDYVDHLFYYLNQTINDYLERMKVMYAAGNGGYKNVLYPDLEIAGDLASLKLEEFNRRHKEQDEGEGEAPVQDAGSDEEIDSELLQLFSEFSADPETEAASEESGKPQENRERTADLMQNLIDRGQATTEAGISLPLQELAHKLAFEPFTLFTFACGIPRRITPGSSRSSMRTAISPRPPSNARPNSTMGTPSPSQPPMVICLPAWSSWPPSCTWMCGRACHFPP